MSKEKIKVALKDELFNVTKVAKIAAEIKSVYVAFEHESFVQDVVAPFASLELKERIYHIRDMLQRYLPNDFKAAASILLKALPPELDTNKYDNDFGDFIYASYSEYVTAYGCSKEHLDFSLQALREITKRFSVEFAIRDFINHYPKESLEMLEQCARSCNYHERRLASEGLRPKLPWAKRLTLDYREPLRHLELLYADETRYVTRSVANHLNDIAKIDAPLVIETLKRWRASGKQKPKEMEYISNHALRTLVKEGNKEALALLGYRQHSAITVESLKVQKSEVKIGESLQFELRICAKEDVKLMVDYVIYFRTKRGTFSPKVFKLKKVLLQKGEQIVLHKKYPLKANMTTRMLYEGEHKLEIQINGIIYHQEVFYCKL